MRCYPTPLCAFFTAALLTATVVTAAAQQAPGLVHDGGLSLEQLRRHAQALGSADAVVRAASYQALTELSASSLPAARAYLDSLIAVRPAEEEALRVLTAFRRGAGSKRADDGMDIAPGVLPVLEDERTAPVLVMAQTLALLRGFEAQTDPAAFIDLANFVGLDHGAWDNELKLLRKRKGMLLLPALLQLRSHPSPAVRRFALAGVTQLGMDDPALALATRDTFMLAHLVRAYSNPPDYAAMPLIVRMVGDTRMQLRDAARAAIDRYGKNAIWQLRELYEEVSSRSAVKAWSFEQSRDELYTVLDREPTEDAQTLLARGLSSFAAGEIDTMQTDFDTLLAKYPEFPERMKLAPGYAAIGGEHLAHDELTAAVDAYRRALRLDPAAADAARWQARVTYALAELALSDGVIDLAAYDKALALDPELKAARTARDTLSGERARKKHSEKRYAAFAALAMLLALAFLTLRLRKAKRPEPIGDAAEQALGR